MNTLARAMLAGASALVLAASVAVAQVKSQPYTKQEMEWESAYAQYVVCRSEAHPGAEGFVYGYVDRTVGEQVKARGGYFSSASDFLGIVLSETYPEDIQPGGDVEVLDSFAFNLKYTPSLQGMYLTAPWKAPARMKSKDLRPVGNRDGRVPYSSLSHGGYSCRPAAGLYTKPKPGAPQPSHKPDAPPAPPPPPTAQQIARDAETRKSWIGYCTKGGNSAQACGCFNDYLKARLTPFQWGSWEDVARDRPNAIYGQITNPDWTASDSLAFAKHLNNAFDSCGVKRVTR